MTSDTQRKTHTRLPWRVRISMLLKKKDHHTAVMVLVILHLLRLRPSFHWLVIGLSSPIMVPPHFTRNLNTSAPEGKKPDFLDLSLTVQARNPSASMCIPARDALRMVRYNKAPAKTPTTNDIRHTAKNTYPFAMASAYIYAGEKKKK